MDPRNVKVPIVIRNPHLQKEFRDGLFFLSVVPDVRPYKAKYIKNNCWRAGR